MKMSGQLFLIPMWNAWGSFFYEPDKDVLRIKAKPVKAEFKEWFTIDFENFTSWFSRSDYSLG